MPRRRGPTRRARGHSGMHSVERVGTHLSAGCPACRSTIVGPLGRLSERCAQCFRLDAALRVDVDELGRGQACVAQRKVDRVVAFAARPTPGSPGRRPSPREASHPARRNSSSRPAAIPVKFAIVAPVAKPTAVPWGRPSSSTNQCPATSSTAAVAGVTSRIAAFWSQALTSQSAAERGRVRAADHESVEPPGRHRDEPRLACRCQQVHHLLRVRRLLGQVPAERVGNGVGPDPRWDRTGVEALQPACRVVVRPLQDLSCSLMGPVFGREGVRDHPPD